MSGEALVAEEKRPGYYKDEHGNWQKDRRKTPDRRRAPNHDFPHHDRRTHLRRKADREALERDHKEMIEDALEDFIEQHERGEI